MNVKCKIIRISRYIKYEHERARNERNVCGLNNLKCMTFIRIYGNVSSAMLSHRSCIPLDSPKATVADH